MDCQEILENGNKESGVYTIWPRSRIGNCQSIDVYCDMETAGGMDSQIYPVAILEQHVCLWMTTPVLIVQISLTNAFNRKISPVLQRRGNFGNAQNYFDKNWADYKHGFGNLKREFWLGNDNIFAITNQGQYSVRFDIKNKEGKSAFSVYETFWIDEESQKYKLHLQDHSGSAGDALGPHNLKEFYTKDQPNVPSDAKKDGPKHTGGWWYNVFPSSNLNGLNNHGGPHKNIEQGMAWNPFGWYTSTLTFSEIKAGPPTSGHIHNPDMGWRNASRSVSQRRPASFIIQAKELSQCFGSRPVVRHSTTYEAMLEKNEQCHVKNDEMQEDIY
ncbi:techylectin-5A [Trichonephila clavipes]|nr:techylectin-5A [Trichonephila clavipes]